MKSVAVIGGGLMGTGIVTALVLNNVPVVLKEVNEEFLQAGLKRIEGIVYLRACVPHDSETRFFHQYSCFLCEVIYFFILFTFRL